MTQGTTIKMTQRINDLRWNAFCTPSRNERDRLNWLADRMAERLKEAARAHTH